MRPGPFHRFTSLILLLVLCLAQTPTSAEGDGEDDIEALRAEIEASMQAAFQAQVDAALKARLAKERSEKVFTKAPREELSGTEKKANLDAAIRSHPKLLDVHIRWMIRRDMEQVLAIEQSAFDDPWDEEAFVAFLRRKNCIGMVAERGDEVLGYMIYELHKNQLHLANFAVHKDLQRRGVGMQMMQKLVNKLAAQRRERIVLDVSENNRPGQEFFKKVGFRATAIKDHPSGTNVYQMVWQCPFNRLSLGSHEAIAR